MKLKIVNRKIEFLIIVILTSDILFKNIKKKNKKFINLL